MERDALACTGIKFPGRCRMAALLVSYGVRGTPRARVVREVVREWFDLLRDIDNKTRSDLRLAWRNATKKFTPDSCSVRSIRGIMSNIIYVLVKANWKPVNMACWEDPSGSRWVIANF